MEVNKIHELSMQFRKARNLPEIESIISEIPNEEYQISNLLWHLYLRTRGINPDQTIEEYLKTI